MARSCPPVGARVLPPRPRGSTGVVQVWQLLRVCAVIDVVAGLQLVT